MYDNVCKYLIETFPEDFTTWLIGEAIPVVQLQPKELRNDPIRADSLILHGQNIIIHTEFQTHPDPNIPLRMADYYLRIRKQFTQHRIHQVVIYLRESGSPLVTQSTFQSDGMRHQFRVIRLWEQPLDQFLNAPGLLPFAVLSQTDRQDPATLLRDIKQRLESLSDREQQGNLTTATAMLATLKLDKDLVKQIMRSQAMRESPFYQEILEEGRQEGRQEGIRGLLSKIVPVLQRGGFPVEGILALSGLTLADLDLEDK